jgi:hypothetical protein
MKLLSSLGMFERGGRFRTKTFTSFPTMRAAQVRRNWAPWEASC